MTYSLLNNILKSHLLLILSAWILSVIISIPSLSEAACLLSFEPAAPLTQGDGRAGGSFFGGSEGLGFSVYGRFGLPSDREIHLRTGGCQRSSMWGGAFEFGIKEPLSSVQENKYVDLALSVSAVVMNASDYEPRGARLSVIGFQPIFLTSYPFTLTSDRKGFVNLSLGMTTYFIDQNLGRSNFDLMWLAGLTVGADLLKMLQVVGEFRAQEGGIYGGLSITYAF